MTSFSQPRTKTKNMVHIYYLDGYFYVIGLLQQFNLVWKSILPVSKVRLGEEDALANAIESSRSISHRFSKQNPPDPKIRNWDGERGTVWKNAEDFWVVEWHDNGSIFLLPQTKLPPSEDRPSETGVAWRKVSGTEKSFPPSAVSRDIAKFILNQVKRI